MITDILLKEDLDLIVSNSYVRAIQTIEELARRLNKEIQIEPRFRE
ncbi:histidine phosphatase family protein [Bacillus sp. BGMRC 2118]|nr:histidine phosphatase family protein [Bacillus sp. BGMRC 2118]